MKFEFLFTFVIYIYITHEFTLVHSYNTLITGVYICKFATIIKSYFLLYVFLLYYISVIYIFYIKLYFKYFMYNSVNFSPNKLKNTYIYQLIILILCYLYHLIYFTSLTNSQIWKILPVDAFGLLL